MFPFIVSKFFIWTIKILAWRGEVEKRKRIVYNKSEEKRDRKRGKKEKIGEKER